MYLNSKNCLFIECFPGGGDTVKARNKSKKLEMKTQFL